MEKFWNKVSKKSKNKCWDWIGSIRKDGYGNFRFNKKLQLAHRVSWELHNGPIPKGKGFHGTCILHKCDNRKCVNPKHLFLGTHTDNMRDMVNKNRRIETKGESNPNSKFTKSDILFIREMRKNRTMKLKELAEIYDTPLGYISCIHRRKFWKNI